MEKQYQNRISCETTIQFTEAQKYRIGDRKRHTVCAMCTLIQLLHSSSITSHSNKWIFHVLCSFIEAMIVCLVIFFFMEYNKNAAFLFIPPL